MIAEIGGPSMAGIGATIARARWKPVSFIRRAILPILAMIVFLAFLVADREAAQ